MSGVEWVVVVTYLIHILYRSDFDSKRPVALVDVEYALPTLPDLCEGSRDCHRLCSLHLAVATGPPVIASRAEYVRVHPPNPHGGVGAYS